MKFIDRLIDVALGFGSPKPPAQDPPIAAPSPASADFSNPLSSGITDELVRQYQGDTSKPAEIDPATREILGLFQSKYAAGIASTYRPLAAALLKFQFALVEDDARTRTETKLGLDSFRLARSGPTPGENVVGEFSNAWAFETFLQKFDPTSKLLVILDGSFPLGNGRFDLKTDGSDAVLAAIEKLGEHSRNISVLVRSGQAGDEKFEARMRQFPFVVGVLGKSSSSCLFQWALGQDPAAIAKIIERAED